MMRCELLQLQFWAVSCIGGVDGGFYGEPIYLPVWETWLARRCTYREQTG